MNFDQSVLDKSNEIELLIKELIPQKDGYQKLIIEAMEYNLLAGGKRIRPMLMKETYQMFGGTSEVVSYFMVALEMIHTYSLVHDDLPAMDNDDYRRGQRTTHVVYGEDIAILTGDALLNYAFELASKAFLLEEVAPAVIGRAVQVLSQKAGIYGMIGGQTIDVTSAGKEVTKEVLDTIYELKTAALVESAMMIGTILAGGSEKEVGIMEQVARRIGLAFQIQDDILDVISTSERLGKPIHSDERNEKTTYVTLIGLDKAKEKVAELTKEALELFHSVEKENTYLEKLLLALVNREK